MNGNDRRRMELIHPEIFPTSEERKEKQAVAFTVAFIGNGICVIFMLLGMLLIAFISSKYTGVTGFWITLIGILLDVIIGALIGLNFGNKMTKLRTEKIIYNKTHSVNIN